jgi:uncharacterized protein (DUF58 family)
MEDREITAWFLLDLSPSMDFGTVEHSRRKRTVVVDFVTTVARLLTRHGNRVGAMFVSDGEKRVIPARGGRNHVLRLINDLLKQPPQARSAFTDLVPLFRAALNSIKRRSLILVVSDFVCAPGWEKHLRLLNHRHEVLTVRVWDPRERELPDVGPILLEDSETGEQLFVDTHDPGLRQRFQAAAAGREAQLVEAFKRAGVDALSLSTGEDLVRALVGFASLRQRRQR